ncbi:MAG: hypothetical protein A2X36_13605 [Elusimicrobia bacterium GWA2_69_24]|nr:MAG: hypothetical protein A2X36_13605 [Elusimicrobia bacterium GWA2_69_24]HBL19025.1 hypothetical protein [Elusimicrobiota bacterium]
MARRDRILVVDDNPDIRRLLRRLLGERFEVLMAVDGRKALAILEREPVDLVITDVMMPALDGRTLAALLRRDPRTRAVPILMLSARDSAEDREEGLAAGADVYLAKPFDIQELCGAAERLIARRRDPGPML